MACDSRCRAVLAPGNAGEGVGERWGYVGELINEQGAVGMPFCDALSSLAGGNDERMGDVGS